MTAGLRAKGRMKDSDKKFLLETLAARIAPGSCELDERGRGEFLRLIEGAVESRPASQDAVLSGFHAAAALKTIVTG